MERSFCRELEALAQVFSFVDDFTTSVGLRPVDAFPFRLAIEEVFVNLVTHNPEGAGDIGIALAQDGDSLVVTLRDSDAPYYDITEHQTTALEAPLQERAPGGLGIHLVRHMMDEVSYIYHNREARIRLVKHFPRKHASDRRE